MRGDPLTLPPSGSDPARASIVMLHGFGADAAVHVGDARPLATHGIQVVIPHAPGHGPRRDGRLEAIAPLPQTARKSAMIDIAREWAHELPALAAACRQGTRGGPVALLGISMGGFAALAALRQPCPFAAVAALLAAPTLFDDGTATPGEPPVLLGLAGRDEAVPPEPGRAFAQSYGATLLEYPESEHIMRGEDWDDLMGKTTAFLHSWLRAPRR